MSNVPSGAAYAAARDKYYVYRPLFDLIGLTEGTDKRRVGGPARGYNETLDYGRLTGGDVDLVSMTLTQIDALQTRMLQQAEHLELVGCRTLPDSAHDPAQYPQDAQSSDLLFDADMQDRMASFLLGQRGIDKYLAGRLSEDTMLLNLAQEWASLPTPAGKGFYGGQLAAVKPEQVRAVLAHMRRRHAEAQPIKTVPVPVDRPVVPASVDREVKQKTGLWHGSRVCPVRARSGWIGSRA